ncbi:MAG: tRNA (adenosine(37)-N6)-dimethylallyltransferase MiaA [Clostridiales bacterium]|nr:tRNA (adenosine(37)-N6)-dimethylallyltransferase MiaA [Clostridiales bacterium]
MEKKIPLVVVVGPTASGKTALAVSLAKRFHGEVISADSMQIYKQMNIATAKPTVEEMDGIPHHLIDCLDLSQKFSVADYTALAHQKAKEINARGHLPILAGGTGLYIDSVVNNISFSEIRTDEELRKELTRLAEEKGADYLLEELNRFDPESAKRLHPNNLSRIIRAIEVYRLTGVTMTEHQRRSRLTPSGYDAVMIGLDFQDRQKLYDRINLRVDRMFADGLLEEAREILSNKNLGTARQAIGYKELQHYFDGQESLEEAIQKIKQETRRYAKRQLTWFRRNPNIHWIYVDCCRDFKDVSEQAALLLNFIE